MKEVISSSELLWIELLCKEELRTHENDSKEGILTVETNTASNIIMWAMPILKGGIWTDLTTVHEFPSIYFLF